MEPPFPERAAPDPTNTDPLDPLLDVPVLNTIIPLDPEDPEFIV